MRIALQPDLPKVIGAISCEDAAAKATIKVVMGGKSPIPTKKRGVLPESQMLENVDVGVAIGVMLRNCLMVCCSLCGATVMR